MAQALRDYRVFWRQFRSNFHTTGSIAPSSRFLACALSRFVGNTGVPTRILEVGPGTGAVTREIVRRLAPGDRLELVELNEEFVRRLKERFESEADFRRASASCRVLHQAVEKLPTDTPYDLIISGLPLNNFSVSEVETILESMTRLLRPGGTLSFFEYIAIRHARAMVSIGAERARLRGIGQALDRLLAPHEIRRDWVWPNLPPAWVHHVRWAS